jgi:hypothetical protein
MAQTGYTPIQLYYSSTTTNAPLAADLANGELAINITDGKLFYKDNANAVQVIAWKVTPTSAGGTGLTSYTAGDMVYYASGTAFSKLGIGAADYVMTSSGTVPQWSQFLKAKAGGTGQTSYAVGDLLYADTTTTLAKLADVATGNALISGGVGAAPSWGKIGLTTHVSGVLPVANGGTNASSASITAFNNITGYTASGATGTTSTNLVFSTSPSVTTPTLVGDVTVSTGNLIVATNAKGIFIGQSTSPNGNVLDVKTDGEVSALNRNTAGDGVIIRYQKQGSTVGYISTNTYSLPSDERVKKNIVPISLGLEFILDLEPVEYNTIFQDPQNESRKNFGLKAQQVEDALQKHGKTVNDVTFLEKFENYQEGESQYGLGYQNLVPVLIRTIHQLQAQINELKGV